MAETTLDLRRVPKADAYRQLATHVEAVLDGMTDEITAMATMSSLIHHAFGNLWTGFYRVVDKGRLLRVGPYQGTLGCLEIVVGRGVCGEAAATGHVVRVDNVAEHAGHIVCDARAKSEIVVPVRNHAGALIAVLDVDADRTGAFDVDDERGLATIVSWFAAARPALPQALA